MLKICLGIWKSEPQYAYERYAYKKNMYLRNNSFARVVSLSFSV